MNKKRQWYTPTLLEVIAIMVFLTVFGMMLIDYRIVFSAMAVIGITIIAAVLRGLKIISRWGAMFLSLGSIPVLIVFWIGLEHYQSWRVVPTVEYDEGARFVGTYTQRTAILEEKPAFVVKPGSLRIDGATSLYDLYLSYAEAVTGRPNPPDVECSRTAYAIDRVITGDCDVAFVFRPSEKQMAAAVAAGKELTITPIGYDAFVFFINADNPVTSLTVRQLKDIYTGKLSNWRQAGGDDAVIIPFQRFEGSGSQSRMLRFMTGEKLMTPEKEHRFRMMRGIVTHVARYRNYRYAVGYSFLYYVKVMMDGGGVKLLGVDGVMPDSESIRDGKYPLAEEICLVTADKDHREVEQFTEWVLSPQGQAMLETIGFVAIRPFASPSDKPKTRLLEEKRRGYRRHDDLM